MFIFDDRSTDRSRALIEAHPHAECITGVPVYSDADHKVSDDILLALKNAAYKSSRGKADWVMVVDIDEFVYHPDLTELLSQYGAQGITLPEIQGFEMVSECPPFTDGQIYQEIRRGFRNPWYSKCAVFDPALEINYLPGSHACVPTGLVRRSEGIELKLLHYRFLGEDYFCGRYATRQASLSATNLDNNWGTLLSVPGRTGGLTIHNCSLEELRARYRQILGEQSIEKVV